MPGSQRLLQEGCCRLLMECGNATIDMEEEDDPGDGAAEEEEDAAGVDEEVESASGRGLLSASKHQGEAMEVGEDDGGRRAD